MAQKIIPCGGWYIDENTLSFDENKVLSVIGGGGTSGITQEEADARYVQLSGSTMTGALNMGEQQLLGVTNIVNGDTLTSSTAITLGDGSIAFDVNGTRVMSMYGSAINAVNHRIQNVSNPQDNTDATNKQYVDNAVSGVQTNIDTVSGTVDDILDGTESLPYLPDNGGTLTGALNMGNNKITMGATPTETTDVTNKGYVDGVVKVVSDEVDGIIAGTTPISVPVATDAKVGGVKIGAGLSVDGEGTLSTAQTYLSTQGGTLEANASITGEDEMTFEVPDSTESATVGITAQGVTIVHNTNSTANARIRVIENNVEIEADGTIVSFDPSGVDFGAGIITNISSIGGASNGEIAFENTIDLNNHQAKNVADPTEAQDGATKNYVDSRTGNASTSTRGVVLQAAGVTDATNANDIITQFNALLASLRTSGVLQDNT